MRNVNEETIIKEIINRAYDNVNNLIIEIERMTSDTFSIIAHTSNDNIMNDGDVIIAIRYEDKNRDSAVMIFEAKAITINERKCILITNII